MIGLGEPEAPDRVTGGHPRQPLLFLLLAAVLPDREHGQRSLHGSRAAHPGVGRFELTARDAVGDRACARAAVSRQVHAEQAQLAQLGQHRPGQYAGLEPVGDLREDMVGNEGTDGVADEPLLVAELVVDLQQVSLRGHGVSNQFADIQGINRVIPDDKAPAD